MSTDAKRINRYSYLAYPAAVVALLALLVALLLPAITPYRDGGPGSHYCTNNLKQFGIALHNYIGAFHAVPPPFVVDERGRRIHSWRAVLLPYFEDEGLRGLYNEKKAWNENDPLVIATPIPIFRCPQSEQLDLPHSNTSYVAVVGPDTAWRDGKALDIDEITDGLDNTIAVVEIAAPGVPWADPRDLTFEEALRGINQVEAPNGISGPHAGGVNVLFFDGHVEFLSNDISPERLRALLTANGGEKMKKTPLPHEQVQTELASE